MSQLATIDRRAATWRTPVLLSLQTFPLTVGLDASLAAGSAAFYRYLR